MRPFDVLRMPKGNREPALRQAAQRQLVAFDLLEVTPRLPGRDAAAAGIAGSGFGRLPSAGLLSSPDAISSTHPVRPSVAPTLTAVASLATLLRASERLLAGGLIASG
ncbi:hypothetical protein [Methylobacterium mesophilicum]|uniref:hypothetical protein n=1 Tax=Methylobacterium mesophilicum TaxID=39956 RepID=UPI001EE38FB2|nr:hypothetical protein [Methylobacterium mesophilicum]